MSPWFAGMAHGAPSSRAAKKPKGARTAAVRSEASAALDEVVQPGARLASLLDDPIRFVGSGRDELKASMSLEAARAAQYEVVNDPEQDKIPRANAAPESATAAPVRELYAPAVVPRFPRTTLRAAGLHNRGNTCYLNSIMQVLLHTPPLANAMLTQSAPTLLGRYGVPRTKKQAAKAVQMFNTVTALKDFFVAAYSGASAVTPSAFIANLRKFARPLRPGRQEDAHEYLRLLLEALQQSCTWSAGKSVPPNDPVLQTTWVQKIFGGRLRSRVTCHECKHHSDTFDPMLDISLDLRKGTTSVKQALDAFTAPETLSDKYRCESCHRQVEATKRFSIDATPLALTVHLKRFTIFGHKINRPVSYSERLHLGRYMSERQKGLGADQSRDPAALSTIGAAQQYRLYAIVHHYGSGPNIGHYVASVRGADGQWLRMDDSHVSPLGSCPLDDPSAYLLLYLREPVALDATNVALTTPAVSPRKLAAPPSPRKRKVPRAAPPVDDALGEVLSRAEYSAAAAAPSESSEEEEILRVKKEAGKRKRRKLARRSPH